MCATPAELTSICRGGGKKKHESDCLTSDPGLLSLHTRMVVDLVYPVRNVVRSTNGAIVTSMTYNIDEYFGVTKRTPSLVVEGECQWGEPNDKFELSLTSVTHSDASIAQYDRVTVDAFHGTRRSRLILVSYLLEAGARLGWRARFL